eukprot:6752515-Alexandrium_andersonii.AAC.1
MAHPGALEADRRRRVFLYSGLNATAGACLGLVQGRHRQALQLPGPKGWVPLLEPGCAAWPCSAP